jgi:hypothetical protein
VTKITKLKQPKLDLAAFARNPIAFVDAMIPLNEKGKPWSLAPYQRRVLALVFTWIWSRPARAA